MVTGRAPWLMSLRRFFALPEDEQQRLRDLQDDPDSPFYRQTMGQIMRSALPVESEPPENSQDGTNGDGPAGAAAALDNSETT